MAEATQPNAVIVALSSVRSRYDDLMAVEVKETPTEEEARPDQGVDRRSRRLSGIGGEICRCRTNVRVADVCSLVSASILLPTGRRNQERQFVETIHR